MSNYGRRYSSTLETFPDELFLEIFDYIPLNDLHRAFFGLNSRINEILRNLSNLFAAWTTCADDRIIEKFAPCISRLVVWRAGYLNLERFKRLRSLKLVLATMEQCQEIQPSQTIEHLHVESLIHSTTMTNHLPILLLNNSFPRLRTCRIDQVTFDHEDPQLILPLYSLITQTQYPERLLARCPRLLHLRLNLKDNVNNFFSQDSHANLRRLELGIYSTEINLTTIETILSLTPNLTRLILDGPCDPPPQNKLDVSSLAGVITARLTELRFIRLHLPLTDIHFDLKDQENEKATLKKLHPLFNHIVFRPRSYYTPGRLLVTSHTNRSSIESPAL